MGKGALVLTSACNLECSFCYAAVEVFQKPKTMSLAEAKRSIDFMKSIGIETYTLLGGEPSVFKHLPEVIRYSQHQGLAPWIVTNGVRTADPKYLAEIVAAGLKGGCISLHGHSAEQHDEATRIAGSFDKAMSAVRLAVENDWPLYPMLTVMDSNLKSVMDVVDNLIEVGCRTIYINYGVPNIVEELDTSVDASPEALARLTEKLFLLQPKLGVRFIFNREKNKVPLCHFNHDLLKDMFAEEAIGTGCEAAQGNTVVIEPGGTVLGCSHWVDHPLLNIFSDYESLELISQEEFWRAWTSGRPLEYRRSLQFYPYEKCADCGWRLDGKCFGGCKVWQEAGVLPRRMYFEQTPHGKGDDPGQPLLPII